MAYRSRLWLDSSLALVLALAPATGTWAGPGTRFVSVGTSDSLYYEIGGALCSVIDLDRGKHGVRCSVESSQGSVYNLEHLLPWDLDFALVQSDAHHIAYQGEGSWQGRPLSRLRSVMSLYPEVLTLLAPANSGIRSLTDLKGKRVNIGLQGSGTRATWDSLEAELNWNEDDLKQAVEVRPDRAGESVCAGELDATLLVVGHLSPIVAADLARCPLWIIPIEGQAVERLVAKRPYYAIDRIRASVYTLTNDVPTFGVRATLVTTADMAEPVVYAVAKALLDHLDTLRAAHPALAFVAPSEMATVGLTAPLHPGAERAFRDHGIVPERDQGVP